MPRRAREPSLRNSAISLRNLGRRSAFRPERTSSSDDAPAGRRKAAAKGPKRLFTKNTGLCKAVRQSIGADACPVPEG